MRPARVGDRVRLVGGFENGLEGEVVRLTWKHGNSTAEVFAPGAPGVYRYTVRTDSGLELGGLNQARV